MRSTDIAIDMGSSNIRVFAKGKGVIISEPSIVAYDKETDRILAYGEEARQMIDHTQGNVVAVRPFKNGTISDYSVTEKMLRYFLQRALGRRAFRKPYMSICVPSGVTEVQRRAVVEAAYQSGARDVTMVDAIVAAAIGAGIDITKPVGNMIMDIGGGTCDIAVLSIGSPVISTSSKNAGNQFNEMITRYIRRNHSLFIDEDKAEEVVEFCRQAGVPVLLSYIHPGFSNGCQQLPPGYAEIDTGDELADEFIATIRGAGLDILDSRTFFEGTGLTEDELWLKTDKHWTSLAELLATGIYAERISEMTGVPIDPALFDPASFTTVVYPENFIGTYGEQAGRRNIVPDDITAFVPRYETDITRHSEQRDDRVDDVSGPFEVSVIRQSLLELDDGKPNETGYLLYGLLEAYEELINHGPCADLTLLVFRDSYSEPICSFLSLGVKRVVSVDLRYYQGTAMEVVRQVQPDLVVFSFSRLMYEANQYDLGLEDAPGDGA